MTKRLTEKWFDDMEQIYRYAPKSPNIEISCGGDDFQRIIDKLAEYEAAEEEGRLWVLPCKVGDLVFKIFSQRDSFDDLEYDIITATNFNYTMIPEIGKTVFLTYKEAEKALKDRQEKPIALSSKIILDKQ